MKYKLAVIIILISVFILGAVIAAGMSGSRGKGGTAAISNEAADPVDSEGAVVGTGTEATPESTMEATPEASPEATPEASPEATPESSPEVTPASEPKLTPEATPVPEATPTPEPLPIYDEYLAVNPYVSGWLDIEGTKINDPVVYTPGSQNYFLHRDIDGSDTSKGTLFIAVNWHKGCNNTLIYGHNMKDGTGFGSLQKFKDASYGLKHNIIRFDTLYEEQEYELLGVFYSQIDEDELETEEDREEADAQIVAEAIARKEEEAAASEAEPTPSPEPTEVAKPTEAAEPTEPAVPVEPVEPEPIELTLFDIDLHRDLGDVDPYLFEKAEDNGRFRYYYYTDLSNEDDFDYYVKNVKERALYDTGVDAHYGDELITLSTCSYQVKNGRFVVVGVRKNDRDN